MYKIVIIFAFFYVPLSFMDDPFFDYKADFMLTFIAGYMSIMSEWISSGGCNYSE